MEKPNLKGYILGVKIGAGTYGTVYKAYKKGHLKDVVAAKCICRSQLSKSGEDNLITEISLLKKLKHENVVNLQEFCWDNDYIYIIMEYCNGGDLYSFIKLQKRLPEYLCREFLRQLARALRYLRESNISHMDLKPQNILLKSRKNPILKIADFGFAQYLREEDSQSSIRGSPLYMAPEILLKHKYDAKVDLWSVGVIFYECLFGKAPFSSKSYKELAEKIKANRPIQMPIGASVSAECKDLLFRLLERDPVQRIEFEEFFLHPFLDLEHAPSEECYPKAVEMVSEAVDQDNRGEYKLAHDLYVEALKYFVGAVQYERNIERKRKLQEKTSEYMNRAEKLKKLLKIPSTAQQQTSLLLYEWCNSTPALRNALEIAMSAENYERELKLDIALENYQMALKSLLPLLSAEPPGDRKQLLTEQVKRWMSQAENVKELIDSRSLLDNDVNEASGSMSVYDHKCSVQ